MIRIGLVPENWKLQLYCRAGIGLLYMSQHTDEQSTQFNFNELGGPGIQYFFTKNFAANVEYRMRHVSNAGIDQPNHGINSHIVLGGVTYQF